MKKRILSFLLLVSIFTSAQDKTVKELQQEAGKSIAKDPTDTIPKAWKRGGVINTNLSQGSLKNWAAGGDEFALSLNSLVSLFAFYKEDRHSWDNTLDFNFGFLRTTTLGSRKNDDRLDLLSKYGYAIAPKWNVAGLFNFRSQLFKGYTFPDDEKTFSSAFLSPAYILLSTGLDFKPNEKFSIFLSPATARWVVVKNDSLAGKGLYGPKLSATKNSSFEMGAFLSANYLTDLTNTISYKGRLDLFSNYKQNPQNIDLFMTNIFSVKLHKSLSASWNLDLIYDDDVRLFGENGTSPALQVKSIVGVGFMLKF